MQTHQVYVPKITFVNKIIISICVGSFILQAIFGKVFGVMFFPYLGLSAAKFFSGHVYQLITYPFAGLSVMGVIFNGLLFWFIGSELEQLWGPKKYLKGLLVSAIGAGLILVVVLYFFFPDSVYFHTPMYGTGGMINFLMLAYSILFPNRHFTFMFLIPIKARYFCLLIIGIEAYMGFFSPQGLISFFHLLAMGVGFLYLLSMQGPRSGKKKKNHLYLVKEEKNRPENEDNPPKYWH